MAQVEAGQDIGAGGNRYDEFGWEITDKGVRTGRKKADPATAGLQAAVPQPAESVASPATGGGASAISPGGMGGGGGSEAPGLAGGSSPGAITGNPIAGLVDAFRAQQGGTYAPVGGSVKTGSKDIGTRHLPEDGYILTQIASRPNRIGVPVGKVY